VDGIIRAVITFDDFNIGLREDGIEIANILDKLTNSFNQTKMITVRSVAGLFSALPQGKGITVRLVVSELSTR
jgi:hypothetical protein